MLRLLSKVLIPDEGSVDIRGRLGGLLELTAGFHPDLTGRENAMIGGVLRGLTRSGVRLNLGVVYDAARLELVGERAFGDGETCPMGQPPGMLAVLRGGGRTVGVASVHLDAMYSFASHIVPSGVTVAAP